MNRRELELAGQRLADAGQRLPRDLLGGPGQLFCYWEWRAQAGGSRLEEPLIHLDGGVRLERLRSSSARAEGWRFLVGAEPEDLELLSGRSRRPGSDREAAAAVERAFGEILRRVVESSTGLEQYAQSTRRGRSGALAVEFGAWARARAWCFVGQPPKSTWESGVRFRARPERGGELFEWSGACSEEGPWRNGSASGGPGFWSPEPSLEGGASDETLPQDYEGPAILLAPAASWWIHEMAHAAFEQDSVPRPGGGGGARIVEDPSAGCWPAGFAIDDRGHTAARSVLWDANGIHAPMPEGHFRRASLKAPARPSLSVTRLEVEASARIAPDLFSSNAPVITVARAGRYDPMSHELLLDVHAVRRQGSGLSAAPGNRFVLRVDVDSAWQNMVVIADDLGSPLGAASCARQGFMNAVMVGAPTVGLDCVRLSRSYVSKTKGLAR